MSHTARRRLTGSVLAGVLLVGAMIYLASLGIPGSGVLPAAHADDPQHVEVSDADRAATLLSRLGVTPETLAAAGASAQDAALIVLTANAYFLAYPDDLDAADAELGAAREDEARLTALVQAGQASENDLSDLGSARAAIAAAESDVALALGVAKAQILGGLTEGQRGTLALIQSNRAVYGPSMSVAVAADAWDDASWQASQAALCHVAQADSYGIEPDGAAAAVAGQTMADEHVSTAASNIAANLPAIQDAWEIAMAGL